MIEPLVARVSVRYEGRVTCQHGEHWSYGHVSEKWRNYNCDFDFDYCCSFDYDCDFDYSSHHHSGDYDDDFVEWMQQQQMMHMPPDFQYDCPLPLHQHHSS